MRTLIALLLALPLVAGAVTITLDGEEIKAMTVKMDGQEVGIMKLKTKQNGKIVIHKLIFKDPNEP